MHKNPKIEHSQSYSGARSSPDVVSAAGTDAAPKTSTSNKNPIVAKDHGFRREGAIPLRFVHFDHASQPSAGQHRRLIRSHVTTLQHQRQRELERKGASSAVRQPLPGEGDTSESVRERKRRKARDFNEVLDESQGRDEGQDRLPLEVEEDYSARKRLVLYQQMAMGRVDPFQACESAADWTVDVPSIIDQCMQKSHSMEFQRLTLYQILAVQDRMSNRKA